MDKVAILFQLLYSDISCPHHLDVFHHPFRFSAFLPNHDLVFSGATGLDEFRTERATNKAPAIHLCTNVHRHVDAHVVGD